MAAFLQRRSKAAKQPQLGSREEPPCVQGRSGLPRECHGKKSRWKFSRVINLLDVPGTAKPKYFPREGEFFLHFPGTSLHNEPHKAETTELRQSLSLLWSPQAKFQCGRCPRLCCPVKGSTDLLCASQNFFPNVFYSFSRKPLSLHVQVTPVSIHEELSRQNTVPLIFPGLKEMLKKCKGRNWS